MHGADASGKTLVTTVELEDFVPAAYPLRLIRKGVDESLSKTNTKFSAMYGPSSGRFSERYWLRPRFGSARSAR